MITERAMLAAVHISIWTAVKHDRKISRDVADQHGAHQGAGRYNKQLLRGADKLDELRTLAGQVRQYFYKITLPWSDEGFRLLPSNLYFDLTARMREFEAGFEQGVEGFLQVYPQYIEQVRPELNGLFREEDYPAADKLRKKFGVKLEILPIPTGNDFRVQMSAEEQARVAREIDANVRESLTRGTEDLWKRLRDVVSHMVDRLNEPESRFHATMVTNAFDLVELLPHLNVNNDADLIDHRCRSSEAEKLTKITAFARWEWVKPHLQTCNITRHGSSFGDELWVVSQVGYSSGGGALRTIQAVGCGERCFQDEYERHRCVAAQGKEEGGQSLLDWSEGLPLVQAKRIPWMRRASRKSGSFSERFSD
jgi:hypothetical protein